MCALCSGAARRLPGGGRQWPGPARRPPHLCRCPTPVPHAPPLQGSGHEASIPRPHLGTAQLRAAGRVLLRRSEKGRVGRETPSPGQRADRTARSARVLAVASALRADPFVLPWRHPSSATSGDSRCSLPPPVKLLPRPRLEHLCFLACHRGRAGLHHHVCVWVTACAPGLPVTPAALGDARPARSSRRPRPQLQGAPAPPAAPGRAAVTRWPPGRCMWPT